MFQDIKSKRDDRERKWKKDILSLVLIIFLIINNAAIVSACSCILPAPPQESLEKSTSVFAGKVTGMDIPDGIVISSADPVIVTFEVSRIWKGPDHKTLIVTTARDGANCGYSFKKGEEYIVYAYGKDDKLIVNICTRTNSLADAQEDLQALGAGNMPINSGSNINYTTQTSNLIIFFLIVLGIISLIVTILVMRKSKK